MILRPYNVSTSPAAPSFVVTDQWTCVVCRVRGLVEIQSDGLLEYRLSSRGGPPDDPESDEFLAGPLFRVAVEYRSSIWARVPARSLPGTSRSVSVRLQHTQYYPDDLSAVLDVMSYFDLSIDRQFDVSISDAGFKPWIVAKITRFSTGHRLHQLRFSYTDYSSGNSGTTAQYWVPDILTGILTGLAYHRTEGHPNILIQSDDGASEECFVDIRLGGSTFYTEAQDLHPTT